jgi:hypothetical protein
MLLPACRSGAPIDDDDPDLRLSLPVQTVGISNYIRHFKFSQAFPRDPPALKEVLTCTGGFRPC